jgi:hypothetical protein
MSNKHLEYQQGGKHYQDMKIQPAEYCMANMTNEELVGVVKWMSVKYMWRDKDSQLEDWSKTKQYIEMITEELRSRGYQGITAHVQVPPLTDDVVPDRRKDDVRSTLFDFPVTRFVKAGDIIIQLKHMVSEAEEFIDASKAYLQSPDPTIGNFSEWRNMLDEAMDFVHSFHTLAHMEEYYMNAVIQSQERVVKKNKDRGYYDD